MARLRVQCVFALCLTVSVATAANARGSSEQPSPAGVWKFTQFGQ